MKTVGAIGESKGIGDSRIGGLSSRTVVASVVDQRDHQFEVGDIDF